MSRRPPVSPRTIGQLVAAALVAIAAIAALGHLHATFPSRDLAPILEGVEGIRGEDVEQITCRRTLPDRPPQGEGAQPDPVGLVRSTDVVSCPSVFDPNDDGGAVVRFVGEVVGDVLGRDGGAWVLMNDDGYGLETGPLPAHDRYQGVNTGLTVWLPDDVVDPPSLTPGRPDQRGDVLIVAGRIHRTDPADGGGLTLRANAAEVVAPAQGAPQPLHERQAAIAVALSLVTGAVALYARSSARSYDR